MYVVLHGKMVYNLKKRFSFGTGTSLKMSHCVTKRIRTKLRSALAAFAQYGQSSLFMNKPCRVIVNEHTMRMGKRNCFVIVVIVFRLFLDTAFDTEKDHAVFSLQLLRVCFMQWPICSPMLLVYDLQQSTELIGRAL